MKSLVVGEKALSAVVALAMSGMMGLTFVDVVGRYVLSWPVPGSSELMQVLMAGVICGALPLVTFSRRHISMDLLARLFVDKGRRVLDVLIRAGTVAVLAFIALCLWQQGVGLHKAHAGTVYLGIPIAPVAFVLSALIAITSLVEAVRLIRHLRTP